MLRLPDSAKERPINRQWRVVNVGHLYGHPYKGPNIFKQVVIIFFSSDADDVMAAKLDLFFTSSTPTHLYGSIYHVFINICRTCTISVEDLISYVMKLNYQLKGKRTCICGHSLDGTATIIQCGSYMEDVGFKPGWKSLQ